MGGSFIAPLLESIGLDGEMEDFGQGGIPGMIRTILKKFLDKGINKLETEATSQVAAFMDAIGGRLRSGFHSFTASGNTGELLPRITAPVFEGALLLAHTQLEAVIAQVLMTMKDHLHDFIDEPVTRWTDMFMEMPSGVDSNKESAAGAELS